EQAETGCRALLLQRAQPLVERVRTALERLRSGHRGRHVIVSLRFSPTSGQEPPEHDRPQETSAGRDPAARARAEGHPAQGDPEGARARRPARERGVQGRQGAPELPAGAHRAAAPAHGGAQHGESRPHPARQGGARLARHRGRRGERRGDGVRDRGSRGRRSDDRAHLAVLADRKVPARPRGGRHRRGARARGRAQLRDPQARDDARPGQGAVAARVTPGALARIALAGEPEPALAAVPPRPGVGQILGPEGRNLVLATTQNLRKWAGAQLGHAPKRREGAPARRPRTNLAGIATAVSWIETDGPFRQRLAYERLSASLVPPPKRRDLKPAAFLHLDPNERFPRVSVRGPGEGPLYFLFQDPPAAEKARDALQRLIPLRPCDYAFEPDRALPLGLNCLYAQMRSCATPCLERVSEEEYRALAAQAARWLADPLRRGDAP